MEKENKDEFVEELLKNVEGENPARSEGPQEWYERDLINQYKQRRDELIKQIEEEGSNVIKDPSNLENLKQQLEEINQALKEKEAKLAVKTGDVEVKEEVEEKPIDNRSDDEKRRDELIKQIEEEESNVIKDPRKLESLKQELEALNKKIKEKETEQAVETGDVEAKADSQKDADENQKEETATEEKEEELRDEKDLSEEEKEKRREQAKVLKEAYYVAMVNLHEKKMQSISKQLDSDELVISEANFKAEMDLEAKMYEARDAYLDIMKADPYTKLRTEHLKQEKEAREVVERQLRNMAKRFKEIEEEIKKIDEREQEISQELLSDDLTEEQKNRLQKELEELGVKRKDLEEERAEIREKLDKAIDTRRERAVRRSGLDREHVKTLSYEDKRNYDYQQAKVATMNQNFDDATKQHYQNIKIRIEQREQRIKDLNKELKEVPETDFERRLLLLNELDKEASMLEADVIAKSDLDRGIIPEQEEAVKEAEEKFEMEEERKENFAKATEEAKIVAEEQKEEIGAAVVESPELANKAEEDRETAAMAATFAIATDSPVPGEDTIVEDVVQYEVAKCVIPGLEGQVKTIDDSSEGRQNAEDYLEQDKRIKEADKQLDDIQKDIEQKMQ